MAVVSLGIDRRTGKRRRVKRTAPDKPTAERLLARLQRQYGKAGDVAFQRLDDYLADWLDGVQPTLAPASYERYEAIVRVHVVPLLGPLRVGDLRPADIRRLIRDRLQAGKHPQTVTAIVNTLKSALSQAVREGELERNVAMMVDMPRVDRDPVEAMTPEMAERILAAVKDDTHEVLYILLLGTGMRVGEACALDWRDIDLKAGTVFIRRGKSRSARRVIPLPRFVVRALEAQRRTATRIGPGVPVFLGERTGERLRVDTPGDQFPRLMVAAGLPRLTLHKLRHGTATLLLQRGVPMRTISEILGHSSPGFTAQVYAHVSEDSKRTAMDSLDGMEGVG